MNIGVYLGSFNPPHIGHLNCLYQALDTKVIDKVLVVPAFKNPWKSKPTDAFDPTSHDGMSLDEEFFLRHNLCNTMFKDLIDEGKVHVSDIEYSIWRTKHKYAEDCIYSHETLSAIKSNQAKCFSCWDSVVDSETMELREKTKIFLVTTVETLVTIPDWKEGKWILSAFPILAMKSDSLERDKEDYVLSNPTNIELVKGVPTVEMTDIPIHSTAIRDKFLRCKAIRPYVNKATEKIMIDKRAKLVHLYEAIAKHK